MRFVARFFCWLRRKHEYVWTFDREADRVRLRCLKCAHMTPGWTSVKQEPPVRPNPAPWLKSVHVGKGA